MSKYPDASQAIRYYIEARSKASSVPSVEGAHLEATADYTSTLDSYNERYVHVGTLDGGQGSTRAHRICSYLDVEACLPADPLGLRAVLLRAIYPWPQARAELTRWSGERWGQRRFYRLWAQAQDETSARLRARGLLR